MAVRRQARAAARVAAELAAPPANQPRRTRCAAELQVLADVEQLVDAGGLSPPVSLGTSSTALTGDQGPTPTGAISVWSRDGVKGRSDDERSELALCAQHGREVGGERVSGPLRALRKMGSLGATVVTIVCNAVAVSAHSGQIRSFPPLPYSRTCLGLSSWRSRGRRASASLTRAPVLAADGALRRNS
jgi:hypothetical protein